MNCALTVLTGLAHLAQGLATVGRRRIPNVRDALAACEDQGLNIDELRETLSLSAQSSTSTFGKLFSHAALYLLKADDCCSVSSAHTGTSRTLGGLSSITAYKRSNASHTGKIINPTRFLTTFTPRPLIP